MISKRTKTCTLGERTTGITGFKSKGLSSRSYSATSKSARYVIFILARALSWVAEVVNKFLNMQWMLLNYFQLQPKVSLKVKVNSLLPPRKSQCCPKTKFMIALDVVRDTIVSSEILQINSSVNLLNSSKCIACISAQ